jgi:hypothetical protein
MNRFLRIAGVTLGVLVAMSATAYALVHRSDTVKMVGIVVSPTAARLDVADQPGARSSIVVRSLKVPGPSWIVVHLDEGGKPGMRIGLKAVPAGTNRDVSVPIDAKDLTAKVIVALHADRGAPGKFDFDMKAFATSPDKPYFVDGMELARETAVR